MKITAIQTSNFIGARAVDVKLTKPVALFAGDNYAGKSSLQEAVRMALTGESVRVSLKKDYGALVTEGQEAGFVEVVTTDGSYSVVLPGGKGVHSDNHALPYVLDAQRFARMSADDRRAFLFGLMCLRTDGEAVAKRMLDRKCDPKKVEQIAPFLRAGFDAGQKEAAGKARDCKAQWKTTTGGETYGSVKAASFRVEKQEVDVGKLDQAKDDLTTIENEIESETAKLGEMQGRARQVAEQAGTLSDLREKAGRFARVQEKLNKDEAELKEWQEKVAALRLLITEKKAALAVPDELTCPGCGESLMLKDGKLLHWIHEGPSQVVSDNDENKLPEYERALNLMESSVANGKRDLAAAEAAAQALKDIDAASSTETPSAEDIAALKARIDALKLSRTNQQTAIRALEDASRKAAEADQKTARAAELHVEVQQWEAIADALAPDGIPGDMLSEALGTINDRLIVSGTDAEWAVVQISKSMDITAGERAYALLSESEKWRADAMIAEAISYISGVKLLVLDRFDVLNLKGREDLLYWLEVLAEDGEIDTALIFGTLKALPAQLPDTVAAFWIENGVSAQIKEAA